MYWLAAERQTTSDRQQTDRQTYIYPHTSVQAGRPHTSNRQTDRETNIQVFTHECTGWMSSDRQTDRQTDRHTGSHTIVYRLGDGAMANREHPMQNKQRERNKTVTIKNRNKTAASIDVTLLSCLSVSVFLFYFSVFFSNFLFVTLSLVFSFFSVS